MLIFGELYSSSSRNFSSLFVGSGFSLDIPHMLFCEGSGLADEVP